MLTSASGGSGRAAASHGQLPGISRRLRANSGPQRPVEGASPATRRAERTRRRSFDDRLWRFSERVASSAGGHARLGTWRIPLPWCARKYPEPGSMRRRCSRSGSRSANLCSHGLPSLPSTAHTINSADGAPAWCRPNAFRCRHPRASQDWWYPSAGHATAWSVPGAYLAASCCTAASNARTPRSKVASHCARWKYGAAAARRGHSRAMKAPSTGSAAEGPLA